MSDPDLTMGHKESMLQTRFDLTELLHDKQPLPIAGTPRKTSSSSLSEAAKCGLHRPALELALPS